MREMDLQNFGNLLPITGAQSKSATCISHIWRIMSTLKQKLEEMNKIGPPLKAEVLWPSIPLVIYCVNCENVRRVTEHGTCSVCGSNSVLYRGK